ncbi:tail completion or Neck1 protein [Burkholderia phage Mica]|uniref:Putative minor tail protein n=1 Tax=Burkholderia phage Mica TaxID=2767579 RepID=A0A873WLR3_9CAUD|nr:tail completion or Neck1 protein [Burkholderia phage Mica]QPB08621.1 putative minor tail protein [Burkholderia phage Mica]
MIHFEIEWSDLRRIGEELGASEKQIKLALSRALARTASKLRTLSARGLRDELELKRLNALRKRLKSIKLRKGVMEGVTLWYGLNDMPVSWFKGRPVQTASGAQFRGRDFPGAFVASSRYAKGKTIFKRTGKARLHIEEQLMPVQDKADVFVEDRIFVLVESIFWPLFQRELQARVKYKIGAA